MSYALKEIVEQGEGSPWSYYDENPGELAHYYQFQKIYFEMSGTQTGRGPCRLAEREKYLNSFDDAVYTK